MQFHPHDYQAYAINKIKTQPSVGLFLDMGCGKTVVTLTAVSELLASEMVSKVLVTAPLQTAQSTWPSEVEKWEHTKHLRVSLVVGSAKQRLAALDADADLYVVNIENVQWLCDLDREWDFDMVILDELSAYKNPSAKRFKALRKKMPFAKRVVGLTGTPAPNGYMDLWSEVYLLDRGQRLGKTVGQYRSAFFRPGRMNGHVVYEWRLNDGAKEQIDQRLSDLCVSMKAVDYLKMPDRVETEIFVQMSAEERKIYDTFGRDHVLPDEGVVGSTAATVQSKLLQMASGFVYDEDKTPHLIHRHKLEAVRELLDAAGQRPVLLMYWFQADRDALREAFPTARELHGPKDIEDWNKGAVPLMMLHPASAGHGINLQEGGNIIVWYGVPWSLELYQQANGRLYRQGQKSTVYIYHILTKDTYDVDVLHALRRKDTTQESLLTALKARVRKWEKA